jgi:NifU-like protein
MRDSLATSEPSRGRAAAQREGVGRAGSRGCGNAIAVRIALSPESDTLAELRVITQGHQLPGDPLALVTFFVGMSTAQALAVTHREIAIRLGGLPESKMYCSVLLHEALCLAIADATAEPRAKQRSCQACVTCRCFTVGEDLIRRAVRLNGLTSLEQVAGYTRAGAGCGLCADGIASILSSLTPEMRHEPHDATSSVVAAATTFANAERYLSAQTKS